MFDPDSLVCEFWGIQIWHHDPCTDGTDDSCGWFYPKCTKQERELADHLIDNEFDNVRNMFGEKQVLRVGEKTFFEDCYPEDQKRHIRRLFSIYKNSKRKWWQHPRFHFWHYHINVPFLRRLFNAPEPTGSIMQDIEW